MSSEERPYFDRLTTLSTRAGFKDALKRISFYHGDITQARASGVVNAANKDMEFVKSSGINQALYRVAGDELQAAGVKYRKTHGILRTGNAIRTPGFKSRFKLIIHTVGPIISKNWPSDTEFSQLAECYDNSFRELGDYNAINGKYSINSIAIPAISTGIYNFPPDPASTVALSRIVENLMKPEFSHVRVVFSRSAKSQKVSRSHEYVWVTFSFFCLNFFVCMMKRRDQI
ncbi:macro domain-containing protein RSc0334-like [Condylostylus longicornis]|uniref:macro domain-containing protein RSc0334-like n=1 Tax=Condylostylus longicornis TaxID=2530218 RepID=UPI00244DA32C|nr:macro domain-containing protein RSc0334-like [Condylostylus longicornis]